MFDVDCIAMDIRGKQNPKISFSECAFVNQCALLMEGKLYTCQVIANSKYLCKKFNLCMPVEEMDYIDIYKYSWEEVLELLAKPVPFCRFCNVRSRSKKFEWGISEQKLEEWI